MQHSTCSPPGANSHSSPPDSNVPSAVTYDEPRLYPSTWSLEAKPWLTYIDEKVAVGRRDFAQAVSKQVKTRL